MTGRAHPLVALVVTGIFTVIAWFVAGVVLHVLVLLFQLGWGLV